MASEGKSEKVDSKKIAEYVMKMGYVPILLRVKSKIPVLPGWQKTTKEKALGKFTNSVINNNVGIVTGESSGIIVIDVDNRENGIGKWKEQEQKYGEIKTYVVKTGSGGFHYYFKYDAKYSGCRKIGGKGLDVKVNGGQVVAAGSIHPSGEIYTVTRNFDVIAIPEWVISYVFG
ncbi:MAG: hypothetical protein Solumvirus4_15 [Solumvirus sp.]|uniref:DNA primase/polymerase bifunctional N-terminal domain-containing protein n=1 Tax=Solumvirus sp. TaxID=2487773 RepID=A0A3G5AGK3_9VIRU|nr:MAG: hypothetical protein Solumvirus4_15 [Solumvirus sp.]